MTKGSEQKYVCPKAIGKNRCIQSSQICRHVKEHKKRNGGPDGGVLMKK